MSEKIIKMTSKIEKLHYVLENTKDLEDLFTIALELGDLEDELDRINRHKVISLAKA